MKRVWGFVRRISLRWSMMRDVIVLAVGIAFVILLSRIDFHITLLEDRDDLREQQVNRAIATDCRVLLVLKQPLDSEGPCYDPEVRKIYKDLPLCDLDVIIAQYLPKDPNNPPAPCPEATAVETVADATPASSTTSTLKP